MVVRNLLEDCVAYHSQQQRVRSPDLKTSEHISRKTPPSNLPMTRIKIAGRGRGMGMITSGLRVSLASKSHEVHLQSSCGRTSGVLCVMVYLIYTESALRKRWKQRDTDWIERFKFTKICLPSATPLTVDAKLSSMCEGVREGSRLMTQTNLTRSSSQLPWRHQNQRCSLQYPDRPARQSLLTSQNDSMYTHPFQSRRIIDTITRTISWIRIFVTLVVSLLTPRRYVPTPERV